VNDYRPSNPEAMHMQSEIAALGLIKRLREYARQPEYSQLYCDLDMAANLLDYFLRSSDDFK
jgi:hypothetical protein